jgi:hypothetical protein
MTSEQTYLRVGAPARMIEACTAALGVRGHGMHPGASLGCQPVGQFQAFFINIGLSDFFQALVPKQ